jgi:NAD(P)-dependent dehydrogenase (short-subunit alcohol dehydrogenase family)
VKPLLDGQHVLVTGGSRGLGEALCRAFVSHGAEVAFTYRRSAEQATALAEEIGARALCVDVQDEGATLKMVRELTAAWDGIDVLVNNAGVSQNLPLALLDLEDFDKVMGVNVRGAYITARAVLRSMIRAKRGVVLNIGSLAGVRMIEAPIHYCASKAAIVGMTNAMAKEVARHGVRVICLAPGLLEEGVGRNLPDHRLADYLAHCSLGRVGKLNEVAELAAFLVSDKNSYMTGATIVQDGGV